MTLSIFVLTLKIWTKVAHSELPVRISRKVMLMYMATLALLSTYTIILGLKDLIG